MASSREWRDYFAENARSLMTIPWEIGPELSAEEKDAIAYSLRCFQAGESSEGKHLIGHARDHALRSGDPDYVVAVRLFIAEEQRHARDLGRFLKLHDLELVSTTLTDRVFRRLRNLFGGLETSIAVLITAEIIAEVYYAVLKETTRSVILRKLCDQILHDEASHVRFQSEQLAKLRAHRPPAGWVLTMALHRFLLCGTILVVWGLHRKTIRRGGLTAWAWWHECWHRFRVAFHEPESSTAIAETCKTTSKPVLAPTRMADNRPA